MPTVRQLELDPTDPIAFGEIVHGKSRGQLTITTISARKDGTTGTPYTRAFASRGAWHQELAKARHATEHHFSFSTYAGACEGGASTGATVQNTLELTAFFQDLDWHKHPVAKGKYADIHAVLDEVDRRCAEVGFPRPGLVTSSGRGLLVAWPHKPVPAYWRDRGGVGKAVRDGALVRWNVIQSFLQELLSDLGADPAAVPACHFFKLPGTVNPKNALTVWTLRQPEDEERDSFSNLYKAVEPAIRAAHERGALQTVPLPKSLRSPTRPGQVVDLAVRRAAALGQPVARRGADGLGGTAADAASLVWAPRLRALVKLAEHRAAANGGALPGGRRDNLLFAVGLAMAWASKDWWWDDFLGLAQRLTPWNEREAHARLSAVVKRSEQEQGQGTGLYQMSSVGLRGLVGLTREEEELEFASPIAGADAQARHALRRLADRRRVHGRADRKGTTGLDREGYATRRKADAADKAAIAREMHAQGAGTAEIAAAVGADPRTVRRYLAAPASEAAGTAVRPDVAALGARRQADASLLYRIRHLSIADGLEPHEIGSRLDVPIAQVRAWLRRPVPVRSPGQQGADSVGRAVCFLPSLPARRAAGDPGKDIWTSKEALPVEPTLPARQPTLPRNGDPPYRAPHPMRPAFLGKSTGTSG